MTTETLETITKAEAEAAEAAAKATAAAEAAQAAADRARQRADEERAAAYREFLDKVAKEAPERRSAALTEVGERRAALESAVRGDGDANVFRAYLRWVEASVLAWEIGSELTQIRDFHGQPVRSVDPPAFNFGMDVGAIVDTIALESQDDAERRITDRRTAFVNGRTA
jgi:vacuolar-type H+-ATPase subunit H